MAPRRGGEALGHRRLAVNQRCRARASQCRAGRSLPASRSGRSRRRPVARLRQRRPLPGHVQHAAAGGQHAAVLDPRAGVEDRDPSTSAAASRPRISLPVLVGAGIALGRHHHGQRGLGIPAQVHVAERAVGGPSRSWPRSVISRGSRTWHSGSPRRTLYSISRGPARSASARRRARPDGALGAAGRPPSGGGSPPAPARSGRGHAGAGAQAPCRRCWGPGSPSHARL